MTSVPTSMSDRETRLLQFYARDRRVVEAGALLGYSTIQLASVARSVVSIDKHAGYTAPTYRQFRSNLERFGVAHKGTPIVGDALDHLPGHTGDLGFLDLTGHRGLTRAALQACRAPLVAIHDFDRAHCPGVAQAIRDLQLRVVEQVDTLVIVEKAA